MKNEKKRGERKERRLGYESILRAKTGLYSQGRNRPSNEGGGKNQECKALVS